MNKHFTLLFFCLMLVASAFGQQPDRPGTTTKPSGPSLVAGAPANNDSVMVTIILKHQQNKNLPEIRRILEAQGFWDVFPPSDCRVISWTIAMGLGHVIIMQAPAGAVRRLNLALENGAWGAFDTEIYITYDYRPIWEDYIEKREEAKAERDDN